MKKKISILAIIFSIYSCISFENNNIEVKITNASDKPITNLVFTTTEKLNKILIDNIVPGETVSTHLSMKDNKLDGSYSLTFSRFNGKRDTINDGYYSNGSPLDQWVDVIVKNNVTNIMFNSTKK